MGNPISKSTPSAVPKARTQPSDASTQTGAKPDAAKPNAAKPDAAVATAHWAADAFTDAAGATVSAVSALLPEKTVSKAKDAILSAEVSAHRAVANLAGNPSGVRASKGLETANALAKLPRDQQLAKLKGMKPAEFESVQAAHRAGWVDSDEVKLSTSVETLARTKWAQTKDGKAAVGDLKKQHAAGELSYADNASGTGTGAWAFTKDPSGDIVLDKSLSGSPEASAAYLGHESVHSRRTGTAHGHKAELEEETDGLMAQSKIWGELSGNAGSAAGGAREDLDGFLAAQKRGGKAGVEGKLGARYLSGHITGYWREGNNGARLLKADEILNHFQRTPAIAKTFAPETAKSVAASMRSHPDYDDSMEADLSKMLTLAPAAARAAVGDP